MKSIFFAALAVISAFAASCALAFETSGSTAFIVDQTTGQVLYEKNADTPLPPASMSKLMTLNMLFEALEDGRVSMDTTFLVSAYANQKGGSKMFLREGAQVRVEDLIRGIIVQSGNDACIVVAENLAGTEEAFAEAMTLRARQLGMTQSTFANSTGWPHPNQRMSARDLVFLADRLISEFPQYYTFFAEESFTWEGITQANRNPLLGLGLGADGLKTGHTSEAGYGLVGSAVQGERRIVFVVSGLDSQNARREESTRIVNWALRQFIEETLLEGDTEIAKANVWMGSTRQVGVAPAEDVSAVVPVLAVEKPTIEVSFASPLPAPISRGDVIGEIIVGLPGDMGEIRRPLIATEDVAVGGLMSRVRHAAAKLGQDYLGISLLN